jgi:hypothetical protein
MAWTDVECPVPTSEGQWIPGRPIFVKPMVADATRPPWTSRGPERVEQTCICADSMPLAIGHGDGAVLFASWKSKGRVEAESGKPAIM